MEKLNTDPSTLAEALIDGIDIDKYIVCTYIVCLPYDYENQFANIAKVIAEEQSIGTWTHVPAETPEVRRRFIGKVLQCVEIPQYEVMRPERKKRKRRASGFSIRSGKSMTGSGAPASCRGSSESTVSATAAANFRFENCTNPLAR